MKVAEDIDIVKLLRDAGFGVVEGKEAVLEKIEEIGRKGKKCD